MNFTEEEMMKWKKLELIDHILDLERLLEANKEFKKRVEEISSFVDGAIETNNKILQRKNHQEEMLFTIGQLQAYKRTFLVIENKLGKMEYALAK